MGHRIRTRLLNSPGPKALLAGLVLLVSLGLFGNAALTWRDLRIAETSSDAAQIADALASAAARQPWDAVLAERAGIAALEAGRPAMAKAYLLRALERGRSSPELHIALGDAGAALGDLAGALAEWRAAAALGAADPALYRRIAEAHEALGQHTSAAEALRQLISLDPEDAAAHYRLGVILAALEPLAALAHLHAVGELDEALGAQADSLASAIATAGLAGDEAYLAGSAAVALMAREEWALAKTALERAIGLNPGYADAYAYLGLVRDQLGENGYDDLRRAVALAPDSALAHSLLGMHFRRLGQPGLAIPELERAYDLDPSNAAICAELGGAYASTGEVAAAEIWLREAVRLAPQSADFWLLLAQFYVESEFHIRAAGLPAAQTAVALAPESAAAHDALGWAHFLLGEFELAGAALNRALALDADLASAHYHLGVLWSTSGDAANARDEFIRAAELDPEGKYGTLARRALARLAP